MTYINGNATDAYNQAIEVALLQGVEHDIEVDKAAFSPLSPVPDPVPAEGSTPSL
jgi:hypothetical protein